MLQEQTLFCSKNMFLLWRPHNQIVAEATKEQDKVSWWKVSNTQNVYRCKSIGNLCIEAEDNTSTEQRRNTEFSPMIKYHNWIGKFPYIQVGILYNSVHIFIRPACTDTYTVRYIPYSYRSHMSITIHTTNAIKLYNVSVHPSLLERAYT